MRSVLVEFGIAGSLGRVPFGKRRKAMVPFEDLLPLGACVRCDGTGVTHAMVDTPENRALLADNLPFDYDEIYCDCLRGRKKQADGT